MRRGGCVQRFSDIFCAHKRGPVAIAKIAVVSVVVIAHPLIALFIYQALLVHTKFHG